jgi:hypothetical protein
MYAKVSDRPTHGLLRVDAGCAIDQNQLRIARGSLQKKAVFGYPE